MSTDLAIYVHGLFMNGAESALLRRRLARGFGLPCRTFSYPTRALPIRDLARLLDAYVQRTVAAERPDRLHFIAHSLGGVVLHSYLEQASALPPGRAVLLGSPIVECRTAAAVVDRGGWARALMGATVAGDLASPPVRCWPDGRPVAVFAGSKSVGLGRFFAGFSEPNDGTVAVRETMVPGATVRAVLPVSHMGMLVSREVALRCGRFLTEGELSRADPYAIS